MPLTDRTSVIHQAHFDLVEANKVGLGIADVWYGDQARIPRTPAICVEAGAMDREPAGVTGKGNTENTFRIYHLIYVGRVQDVQVNVKQAQELSEALMDLLHVDMRLGGLVLYGYVRTIEPGFVRKADAMLKVQRLLWQGMNKTRIL